MIAMQIERLEKKKNKIRETEKDSRGTKKANIGGQRCFTR